MANKDLFTQAIADAKSVREAAIANAKAALEESLTPQLKELLAQRLAEMEEEADEKVISEEEVEETTEVVAEEEGAEDEEAEDDSEESEDEAEDEAEGEEPAGEEEIADSDLTVDDLKDMIRDIISQEMGGMDDAEGEEEGMEDDAEAHDMAADDMTAADDEEINLEELMAELAEMATEETVTEETVEEGDYQEEGEHMEEETMDESFTDLAVQLRDSGLVEPENAMAAAKALVAGGTATVAAVGGLVAALRDEMGKKAPAEDLNEALETLETLRNELNESNLLNAKLLYVNKVFKANSLSEAQKANVIAAFDKAETVKEVKLVFETVSENIPSGAKKEVVREAKGFASAAVGTSTKPEVITETNSAVLRMQKLAGIIK